MKILQTQFRRINLISKAYFQRYPTSVALIYLLLLGLVFLPIRNGVGQYWDWSFPYYQNQISAYFSNASTSWTNSGMGSPLSYVSDIYVRYMISLFSFVKPEYLVYAVIICLLSCSAYGVYLLTRQTASKKNAFCLGLLAVFNPTIFYKYTAGHIDYLVAYALFIYLVYFLFYKFHKDYKSSLVIALIISFIGVQIQFFVITALFVLIYFVLNRKLWSWKFLPIILLVPLLINAVWLSNFIFGGADISAVSSEATKASFRATNTTQYSSMFAFFFSKATLIARYYTQQELWAYMSLFLMGIAAAVAVRGKSKNAIVVLIFMLTLMLLGTGFYLAYNLGPITTLYPMFREVGHFAPLIVLCLLILVAMMPNARRYNAVLFFAATVLVSISVFRFGENTKAINYEAVRNIFSEFNTHQVSNSDDSRVLAYPFFDQYQFNNFEKKFSDRLPIENSGHDSFSTFSKSDFIKNAVKPQDFKSSVQFKFLQSYDVDILRAYSVGYIYDFSNIYTSFYDRYVPASTYDGDLDLIKNDPSFLNKVEAKNPGKVRRISAHILKIIEPQSRVSASSSAIEISKNTEDVKILEFLKSANLQKQLDYVIKGISGLSGISNVKRLFGDIDDTKILNLDSKSFEDKIDLGYGNGYSLYTNNKPTELYYRSTNGLIEILGAQSGALDINGKALPKPTGSSFLTLARIPVDSQSEYYLMYGSSTVNVIRGQSGLIGAVSSSRQLGLYKAINQNLISNPSFELGAWTRDVIDCNNYDKNPKISMATVNGNATEGDFSLKLSAGRHIACTSKELSLQGNSKYVLSYDYKGQNTDMASFYLPLDGSSKNAIRGSQAILDDKWHSYTKTFDIVQQPKLAQLFIQSTPNKVGRLAETFYDNFSLRKIEYVSTTNINLEDTYSATDLSAINGTVNFSYTNPGFMLGNLLSNGSFSDGLWQDEVSDCNNYDSDPDIGMKLVTESGLRKNVLQLEAAKHYACTSTLVNVNPGQRYLLSFDYNKITASEYGYRVEFNNDAHSEIQGKDSVNQNGWNTKSVFINVPEGATTARVFLYSYDSDNGQNNVVQYDNVSLVESPNFDSQYFLYSKEKVKKAVPRTIDYDKQGAGKYSISVRGAASPFYMLLSESYHAGWALRATGTGNRIAGLNASHFKYSNYGNGWYLDPNRICATEKLCKKNTDGSYDIDLIAEFEPSQAFTYARAIGVITVFVVGFGLVWLYRRKEKNNSFDR